MLFIRICVLTTQVWGFSNVVFNFPFSSDVNTKSCDGRNDLPMFDELRDSLGLESSDLNLIKEKFVQSVVNKIKFMTLQNLFRISASQRKNLMEKSDLQTSQELIKLAMLENRDLSFVTESTANKIQGQQLSSRDEKKIVDMISSDLMKSILNGFFSDSKLSFHFPIVGVDFQMHMKNAAEILCNVLDVKYKILEKPENKKYICTLIRMARRSLVCDTERASKNPDVIENERNSRSLPRNKTRFGHCEIVENDSPKYEHFEYQRAVWALYEYAYSGDLPMPGAILKNGNIVMLFSYIEKLSNSEKKPSTLAALIKSTAQEDVYTVVIRGTKTSSDWIANFDYAETTIYSIITPTKPILIAHQGFSNLANVLAHQIYSYFNTRKFKNIKLVLTGHSMGGAVANILRYQLWETGLFSKIDVVTFGSPSCIYQDQKYKEFSKIVGDVVNIIAESDPVPYFPCTKLSGLTTCANVTSKRDYNVIYAPTINRKLISMELLSNISKEFAINSTGVIGINLKTLKSDQEKVLPVILDINKSHNCSYQCALTLNGVKNPFCVKKACQECIQTN